MYDLLYEESRGNYGNGQILKKFIIYYFDTCKTYSRICKRFDIFAY